MFALDMISHVGKEFGVKLTFSAEEAPEEDIVTFQPSQVDISGTNVDSKGLYDFFK